MKELDDGMVWRKESSQELSWDDCDNGTEAKKVIHFVGIIGT